MAGQGAVAWRGRVVGGIFVLLPACGLAAGYWRWCAVGCLDQGGAGGWPGCAGQRAGCRRAPQARARPAAASGGIPKHFDQGLSFDGTGSECLGWKEGQSGGHLKTELRAVALCGGAASGGERIGSRPTCSWWLPCCCWVPVPGNPAGQGVAQGCVQGTHRFSLPPSVERSGETLPRCRQPACSQHTPIYPCCCSAYSSRNDTSGSTCTGQVSCCCGEPGPPAGRGGREGAGRRLPAPALSPARPCGRLPCASCMHPAGVPAVSGEMVVGAACDCSLVRAMRHARSPTSHLV